MNPSLFSNTINGYSSKNEEEMMLSFIYETLIDLRIDKKYDFIDEFLELRMNNVVKLTPDQMVHIVNPISPVREYLKNFDRFLEYCENNSEPHIFEIVKTIIIDKDIFNFL